MSKLFSLLLGLLLSGTLMAQEMSNLELEWESVEGASSYEIQLTPKFEGTEPLVLKLEKTKISRPMREGQYSFRIRSITTEDGPGPWSDPVVISVLPLTVKLLSPEDGASLVGKGKSTKQQVVFKWQPAKGAKRYRLRVWSKSNDKEFEFKTTRTEKALALRVGRTYYWEVRATGQQGERYEMAGESFRFRMLGEPLPSPDIHPVPLVNVKGFAWDPVEKAKTYSSTLFRKDLGGGPWRPVQKAQRLEGAEWKLPKGLEPGRYKLEAIAHNPVMLSSEPGVLEFLIKPTMADLSGISDLEI